MDVLKGAKTILVVFLLLEINRTNRAKFMIFNFQSVIGCLQKKYAV